MICVADGVPVAIRERLEAYADTGWADVHSAGAGLRRMLLARVPWPEGGRPDALPAPHILLTLAVGSLPVLRLGYVLHVLPFADACAVAYACACACRELWLADFVPAERNLGLVAALAARALPGLRPWGSSSAAGRDWLAHGGLEGCLYGAGLSCLSRRTFLGGAALLVRCGLPPGRK